MTSALEDQIARLDGFATEKAGWLDGYGEVISPLTIEAAKDVVKAVSAADVQQPATFMTEEGGVQVEWMVTGDPESIVMSLELVEVDGVVHSESFALFIHKFNEPGKKNAVLSVDDHTVLQGIDFAISILRLFETPAEVTS
jgi:hypothetical protein